MPTDSSTTDQPAFGKLCVAGLGYVGLPTAAVFASRGLDVVGYDINAETVALINDGRVHIVEPELDILVNGAVARGKLRAATAPEAADVFIIAVPTPFKDGHKPDLGYVQAASDAIAPVLQAGNLVIVESTSPVGTTEQVSAWLAAKRLDLTFPHSAGETADVCVAHSPERVLPGRVLIELTSNDRVVGGLTRRCAERAAAFYKIAVAGRCLLTKARTAELVKLAENAYRDVNIAFANELDAVGGRLGIDVWEAIDLANHHPRVNILQPGPGVGGHCIAVDPWFIVDSAPDDTPLIQAARQVNDDKPKRIVAAAKALVAGIDKPTLACLGLAYKADIDDLRESPAVEIVCALAAAVDGSVLVVEPYVDTLPDILAATPNVHLTDIANAYAAADAIVLLTDHQAFRENPPPAGRTPVIDSRNAWPKPRD
ncbi:MAG: UDP-N-acetyl-D-mannosamine dehydrogenase [Rhodospirillaceae bacterium]